MEYGTPTAAEYADAFGVELPAETPAEPPAEPVTETPEGKPAETPPAETTAEPAVEPAVEAGKGAMPLEERSQWAARRRKWEERERLAVEEAAQARVDQVYADIFKGQVNPVTGKPILTEADYKAVIAERERQQQQQQLQKVGIDPQIIQSMVDRQMEPLKQQMESERLNAIQEKAKAANARFEAALKTELQKVTAMDPSIKTLEDIAAMPNANVFNSYVQKGLGVEDAFYLANRKEIDERRMMAARTAMQEQLAGKGHLEPVQGGGKPAFEVTAAQRKAYREFMPNATDAEIQKAYESAYKK